LVLGGKVCSGLAYVRRGLYWAFLVRLCSLLVLLFFRGIKVAGWDVGDRGCGFVMVVRWVWWWQRGYAQWVEEWFAKEWRLWVFTVWSGLGSKFQVQVGLKTPTELGDEIF
jgi:hypothetical protein